MGTESGHNAFIFVALALSLLGAILSGVAFLRVGSLDTQVKTRHRFVTDELAVRIRRGLDALHSRSARAKERLAEARNEAPEQLREAIDDLSDQLSEIDQEVQRMIRRSETHLSSTAATIEEALSKRLRRVEAGIQILVARRAIHRAEKLAYEARFAQAESLLEDATAKVREVQARLADDTTYDQGFVMVIEALHDATYSVRGRARDAKRDIESVLDASDMLLASLKMPEHAVA